MPSTLSNPKTNFNKSDINVPKKYVLILNVVTLILVVWGAFSFGRNIFTSRFFRSIEDKLNINLSSLDKNDDYAYDLALLSGINQRWLPTQEDHILGNPESDILLIEYGDYLCPVCVQTYPTIKKFVEDNSDEVSWIFRQFPVTSTTDLAMASECVARLKGNDAFWKFSDSLFSSNFVSVKDTISANSSSILSFVGSLDMEVGSYISCVMNRDVAPKLTRDASIGNTIPVKSVPTLLFLNKRTDSYVVLSGNVSGNQLKYALDRLSSHEGFLDRFRLRK